MKEQDLLKKKEIITGGQQNTKWNSSQLYNRIWVEYIKYLFKERKNMMSMGGMSRSNIVVAMTMLSHM